MLRFPNPGSDISAFVRTFQALFGALRHEDTGEITWLEEFSEEHAIRVTDGVKRIQAIITKKSQGEPTSNKRKCTSCRLRLQCDVFR